MEIALSFLHLAFVGFVALFPPVNPIGTALLVDPLLKHLDDRQRRRASFRIAVNCFVICAITLLIGSWLFKLFGISLPIVQVAGGTLICKMGWDLLSSNDEESAKETAAPDAPIKGFARVQKLLFYPLAFPMTTGAGTISVLLTLSAHSSSRDLVLHYFMNLGALFAAVFFMCGLIYVSYAFTPALTRRLGADGEQIVNRLSAFLVFCVGLQIAAHGVISLVHNQ